MRHFCSTPLCFRVWTHLVSPFLDQLANLAHKAMIKFKVTPDLGVQGRMFFHFFLIFSPCTPASFNSWNPGVRWLAVCFKSHMLRCRLALLDYCVEVDTAVTCSVIFLGWELGSPLPPYHCVPWPVFWFQGCLWKRSFYWKLSSCRGLCLAAWL